MREKHFVLLTIVLFCANLLAQSNDPYYQEKKVLFDKSKNHIPKSEYEEIKEMYGPLDGFVLRDMGSLKTNFHQAVSDAYLVFFEFTLLEEMEILFQGKIEAFIIAIELDKTYMSDMEDDFYAYIDEEMPDSEKEISKKIILPPANYLIIAYSNFNPVTVSGRSLNTTISPIKFTYDGSGNRIERVINMTKSATALENNDLPITTITDRVKDREIRIYPNPTKGNLKVEVLDFDKIKNATLNLLNMQGQSVMKTKMVTNLADLDISNRPNGIYILQIIIDGKASTWKIIKE